VEAKAKGETGAGVSAEVEYSQTRRFVAATYVNGRGLEVESVDVMESSSIDVEERAVISNSCLAADPTL
jgi:hypothetical protein